MNEELFGVLYSLESSKYSLSDTFTGISSIPHHEVLCTPQELKEERTTQVGDAVPKFQEFPIRIYQETRKKCDYKNKGDLGNYWRKTKQNVVPWEP